MIRAVLFDLDDTLYPEIEFIRGGFRLVAEFLAARGLGSPEETAAIFEDFHWRGNRDRVFQQAAAQVGYPEAWIPELVWVYRRYQPQLVLPEETRRVLHALCGHNRLGVITDGHREVQWRKVRSLGIEQLVDVIVTTDDFGRRRWKPDPQPFLTACRALRVQPPECVFVGDHPIRDIHGAARLGMKTIRIRRGDGYFANSQNQEPFLPDAEILCLNELPDRLVFLGPVPVFHPIGGSIAVASSAEEITA